MGLDTSHDAWHGAYSAFSRWRDELCKAAGYAMWPVKGEYGLVRDTPMIDWGHLMQQTDPDMQGGWTTEPDDPLMYLVLHSDCDGELSPDRCARLADRLAELIPLLPEQDDTGHIGNWAKKTQQFVDGCREAAAAGDSLDFH